MNESSSLTNLRRSRIGVGCAYLTAGSLTGYDQRIIETAFEAGARHFDVAPMYGLGTAESVLGKAVRAKRNSVTIATKAGIARPSISPLVLKLRALASPIRSHMRKHLQTVQSSVTRKVTGNHRENDYSPGTILASLDESLRLLQTDRVDLFLLHMVPNSQMNDDLIDLLLKQKSLGKALSIGLATDRETTAVIIDQWPGVFDVAQYSWCALDPPLNTASDGGALRITHGALSRALTPITERIANDSGFLLRLSHLCDENFADPIVLSRALIGASIVENQTGMTLVASRSIERTRENIQTALSQEAFQLGQSLLRALRQENMQLVDSE